MRARCRRRPGGPIACRSHCHAADEHAETTTTDIRFYRRKPSCSSSRCSMQLFLCMISTSVLWMVNGYTLPSQKQYLYQHSSKRIIQTRLWMASSLSSSEPFNQTMMYGASTMTAPVWPDDDSSHKNTNINNKNHHRNHHHDNSAPSAPLPPWLQNLVEQDQANPNQDIPIPTANGGFTHTTASKAKIAAANKGKVPWNKGQARSEETKARIAEGVRKRNRENFLVKLAERGMTEDDYMAQEAQLKAQEDAEKSARKTTKGGYRLTDETKQKISDILKSKWASGQFKKTKVHPSKVRRGFVHSEETRAKISESLRKRWATDPDYRAVMVNKTAAANTRTDVRQRISESLKRKWEDPVFRATMTAKISSRQRPALSHGQAHREKIAEAIRAKWQDDAYRQRAVQAMAKRAAELAKARPPRVKVEKPKPRIKAKEARIQETSARMVQPMLVSTTRQKKIMAAQQVDSSPDIAADNLEPPTLAKPKVKGIVKAKKVAVVPTTQTESAFSTAAENTDSEPKAAKKKRTREKAGSVKRLREERRDLYDLLYGDDDDEEEDRPDRGSVLPSLNGVNRKLSSVFFEDEDLDDFDPYGLDDD